MNVVRLAPQARTDPWRHRARRVLTVVTLLATALLVLFLLQGAEDDADVWSPRNPQPEGAKALARVLDTHGVDVTVASSAREAIDAVEDDPDATLLVVSPASAQEDVRAALLDARPGRLVLVGFHSWDLRVLDGVEATEVTAPDPGAAADSRGRIALAECEDETAARAGSVSVGRQALTLDDGWAACFPAADGYLWGHGTQRGVDTVVVADADLMRNDTITQAGNASLLLSTLGVSDHLVWYRATPDDTMRLDAASTPTWLTPALMIVLAALLVWAIASGARLGPLVTEDVPLVVPAAETVVGRGRLHERAHDRAHAASTLRLDAARRLARRLGVAEGDTPDALLEAVRRALPPDSRPLADRLTGPAPRTDRELRDLARDLDRLMKEIRHDR